MSWWNSDWQYRKEITITNNTSDDLTDFQVKLEIDTASLISDSKLNSDCSDLRFIDSDDSTQLGYWIQEGCNTSSTIVWVKVSIPANGSTTIYMYYGNPNATSESNGENVFEFFDDFDGDSLDTSKWNSGHNIGTQTVSNSYIDLYEKDTSNSKNYSWIASVNSISLPSIISIKYNLQNMRYNWDTLGFATSNSGFTYDSRPTAIAMVQPTYGGISGSSIKLISGSDSNSNTNYDTQGQWYIRDIYTKSGDIKEIRESDNDSLSLTTTFSDTSGYIFLGYFFWYSGATLELQIDWVFVRKYASSDPTYSVGSEEQPAIKITNVTYQDLIFSSDTETVTVTTTLNTSSYSIDWGDGNTDTGTPNDTSFTASHSYNTGVYTITVTVTDSNNNTDSQTFQVKVYPATGIVVNSNPIGNRKYQITRATNKYVDNARVHFLPQDNIQIHDEVEIFINKNKLFGGYINSITGKTIKDAEVLGYGVELDLKGISKVWYNIAPEDIVKELVNDTNLTYSSTATSGITLDKYLAQDKRYSEVIKDISELLDWQIMVTPDKKFYFEPKGYNEASYSVKIIKSEWHQDTSKLMNDITLYGGKATYSTMDSFTGDGSTKEFTLTYSPIGNIRVLVGGAEKVPDNGTGGDYTVDADSKKITFTTAPADSSSIQVYYSYEIPIRLNLKNNNSINKYGNHFRKIEAKWIKTFNDARTYARKLLSMYSDPIDYGELTIAPNYNVNPGDRIYIVDTVNNVSDFFVIQEVQMTNTTYKIKVGEYLYDYYEWKAEVEERIKQLEESLSSSDFVSEYKLFTEQINTKVSITRLSVKYRKAGVYDSTIDKTVYPLICDHPDYGKVEYSTDTEVIELEKGYTEWKIHYQVG